MAIITNQYLTDLRKGFSILFQTAFDEAEAYWPKVATLVPSTTGQNTYGWLGQFPKMREWVGDRVIKSMQEHGYTLENKKYEATVGVQGTDLDDDNIGIYAPLFSEMGYGAKTYPDEHVFGLLGLGESNLCYDGQNFFDTDHPVYPEVDGTGTPTTVSNHQGGTGTAWYLMATKRALKPLIFQQREKPKFTVVSDEKSENVFMRDEHLYGTRARSNVGFGMWQMAQMSRQDLSHDTLDAAIVAMQELKADGGRPLGLTPDLLVVPPRLHRKALEVVKASRLANGASNTMEGVVEVLSVPWLA